jgi:hypothetical protein
MFYIAALAAFFHSSNGIGFFLPEILNSFKPFSRVATDF